VRIYVSLATHSTLTDLKVAAMNKIPTNLKIRRFRVSRRLGRDGQRRFGRRAPGPDASAAGFILAPIRAGL